MRSINFLLLTLVAAVLGCGSNVRTEADKAAKRGDWQTAAQIFRTFLEENPGRFDIRKSLAAIECNKLKNMAGCLENTLLVLERDQGDTVAAEMAHYVHFQRAKTFYDADSLPEARAELKKAAERYMGAAHHWYERQSYGVAVRMARRASELNPTDTEIWMWLGTMEYTYSGIDKRRLDSSAVAYEKAFRLDRKNPDTLRNLIVVYREAGRMDDANRSYDNLLKLQKRMGLEVAEPETTAVLPIDSLITIHYEFPPPKSVDIPSW